MKKTNFIAVMMLLMLSINVFGVSTKLAFQEDVRVSMINQDPDPAEPGRYVDVRFKFENYGSEGTGDIIVDILPEYPLSLIPGEDAEKDIGSLQSRQLGETGIIVKYKMKIDENAVEGNTELVLRYRVGTNDWIKLDEFQIDIQTHDAILDIRSVKMVPELVKPGGSAKLKLTLENMADSLLKDIKTKLTLDDVPVATLGSGNEKTIKLLEGGKFADVEFELAGEPDATPNLYSLPIELSYNDNLGNSYSKTISTGITVGSNPDLSVLIDSSEIKRPSSKGDITVKFVNKGLTDIKFLNIVLEKSDIYTMLSPAEVYIGNIDSDDYETADYTLSVGDVKAESLILTLNLEYKDFNNNEYKEVIDLEIPLYSAKQAKEFGYSEGNSGVGIFIVIAIVVAGIFVYRRWKKRKVK